MNLDADIAIHSTYEELTEKLERCRDCCRGDYMSYHCPLCPLLMYKPRSVSKVKSHLEVHWKTGLRTKDGKTII